MKKFYPVVALMIVITFSLSVLAQPQYRLITLDFPTNTNYVYAINDSGLAVGMRTPTPHRATLWEGSSATDLHVLIGSNRSRAYDINEHGTIVGNAGNLGAFMIQDGVVTTFIESPEAHGVNNLNQWVGHDDSSNSSILLWDEDTGFTHLNIPPPVHNVRAEDINDHTQVVGVGFYVAPQNFIGPKGSIWEMGDLGWEHVTLPVDPSHGWSQAKAINNLGIIAGNSMWWVGFQNIFGSRACVWQRLNGTWKMKILPVLLTAMHSEALDINNQNQVVGWSNVSTGGTAAVLWQNGNVYNLNDLVALPSGWSRLADAYAISDSGYISGWGVRSNNILTAYLLVPDIATSLCEN